VSGRRILLVVIAAVVGFNLLLTGLDRLTRDPSGPRSSSYATAPRGLAAYAGLLARNGHPVRRVRDTLGARTLRGTGTVVLLDPDDLLVEEARALSRFVRGGGRLIAGGRFRLERLLGERAPTAGSETGRVVRVLAPTPETAGVRRVRTAGEGGWEDPAGLLPVLGPPDAPVVVTGRLGRGRLVLVADPSPLQNRLLGAADNAALGLALAGRPGRPVAFAEGAHGFGPRRGLGALPTAWKWALGGLLLAALVWLASRARRLGPPEDAARELPPPRRAYVEALAAALQRTRRRDEASAPVARAARDQIAERARLGADPPEDALRAAARDLELTDEEVAALLGPANDEDAVLARGRALARTSRGGA
jgi:hypothetical protein